MTPRKRYQSDNDYNKQRKIRYATDKKYRERKKASVERYNKTKKGKISLKKGQNNFKKNHPNYMTKYMKKRRNNAIKNGRCIKCLKRNNNNKYLSCKKCREKDNIKHINKYEQINDTFFKRVRLLFKRSE